MSDPLSLPQRLTLYRYITGQDDSAFCHRVTEALSKGWSLYGASSLTFDAVKGHVVCGQAVTKDVSGIVYDPSMKLSEH